MSVDIKSENKEVKKFLEDLEHVDKEKFLIVQKLRKNILKTSNQLEIYSTVHAKKTVQNKTGKRKPNEE